MNLTHEVSDARPSLSWMLEVPGVHNVKETTLSLAIFHPSNRQAGGEFPSCDPHTWVVTTLIPRSHYHREALNNSNNWIERRFCEKLPQEHYTIYYEFLGFELIIYKQILSAQHSSDFPKGHAERMESHITLCWYPTYYIKHQNTLFHIIQLVQ